MSELEARKAAHAAKIAAMRDTLKAAEAEQEMADLEAILPFQEQYGFNQVKLAKILFKPGRPCTIAFRCPNGPEMKRWRAGLNKTEKGQPNPNAAQEANELLASAVIVWPPADEYAAIREELPAVHAQIGNAAANMALATESEEVKG
jgi:hypothetical protein